MYLGIDVGGTKLQYAVCKNEAVTLLDKIPTPTCYEEFLNGIKKIANQLNEPIEAVGIGIPGTFTDQKVIWVPNIPCLEGKDLIGDVSKMVSAPVRLGNDAQLALLGEVWMGAGKGKSDAILMSIGTGIGGAIMVGGKLLKGRRGAAGALGWLNLDARLPFDRDHGYFEKNASGSALADIGKKLSPPLSTYEIVKKARQGDQECVRIFEGLGHLYGTALASITSVLDTQIAIVSGGLSEVFDLYKVPLLKSFRDYSAPGVEEIPVLTSQLGSDSGVYGALRLAITGDVWI